MHKIRTVLPPEIPQTPACRQTEAQKGVAWDGQTGKGNFLVIFVRGRRKQVGAPWAYDLHSVAAFPEPAHKVGEGHRNAVNLGRKSLRDYGKVHGAQRKICWDMCNGFMVIV
jgi:hypothetical protein